MNLPVIDIRGLQSDRLEDRRLVAMQLREACESRGFFYVSNHGLSSELREQVFGQIKSLFDLPLEEKMTLDKSKSPCNRGYQPMSGQTLQQGTPPDLKEGYYVGEDLPATDPRVMAKRFNHGANVWPQQLQVFKPVMEEYFAQALQVVQRLMRGLALSLDLDEHAFDKFMDGGMGTLFLLHYPPQPANPKPNERGCGEHTDFGGLTLLAQGDVGGLQVLDVQTNTWIDAPPIPDTFVVNIGDLMARWTNNRYHSTLHRVVNLSGRERYSLPFFYTGHPDYVVECLPGCLGGEEAPALPPITVEQHLSECYNRMYETKEPA